jgi:hypothetical protein
MKRSQDESFRLSPTDDAASYLYERFIGEGEAFEANARTPQDMQRQVISVLSHSISLLAISVLNSGPR